MSSDMFQAEPLRKISLAARIIVSLTEKGIAEEKLTIEEIQTVRKAALQIIDEVLLKNQE